MKKEHTNQPVSFWNTVLFSDKSKYNVKKSDSRVRVWRKPGEEYSSNSSCSMVINRLCGVCCWCQ